MKSTTTQRVQRAVGLLVAALALTLVLMPGSDAQGETVIINEIMPANVTGITDGDGDIEDWIELRNVTGAPIDLSNWQIRDDGAAWDIPVGTSIDANGFLLIWASDKGDPFNPDAPGPLGELHANFKLSRTGDSVTLVDSASVQVDAMSYTQVFDDDTSYGRNDAGVFVLFGPGLSTPLAPNGVAPTPPPGPPSIVFNEVMQVNNTTIQDDGGLGNFEDWFELYNPTCASVDLTGWTLRDSSREWALPAGTVLDTHEWIFIWASGKGLPNDDGVVPPAGEVHTNFRLSATEGETISLLNAVGELVASVNPGPSLADESYARTADGTYVTWTGVQVSPDNLNPGQVEPICIDPTPTPTPVPGEPTPTPTATPTPSPTPMPTPTPLPTPTPPACVSSVVINEVQSRNDTVIADGDGDFSDWIELYNPTSSAIDLSNWRVSDAGNTFLLATGTTIGADDYLLIWASDKGDPDDPGFPGPADEIHANFRLSGSGDRVVLASSATCEVDRLALPALGNNQSYGVLTDGSRGVFTPGFATPLRPNGAQTFPPRQTCYAVDSPIRMNLIVAKNDALRVDADGDASDFIELRNTGFDPVDLSVWQISDESDRWIIPSDTILPGYSTLIIWASGKGDILDDRYPGPTGELHASFKLTSDGEQVTLAEPSECLVDQVIYPALGSDQAFGFDEQGQRRVLSPRATEAVCAAPGSVQIVAVSSKNDAGRADEDGDFGDWFELRNPTDTEIDLSGWVVGDDGSTWVIPDGVLLVPEGERVVWADEKDRGDADSPLHASFKLSGDGETLSVSSSPSCLVDVVSFPALDDDQVYRRGEDGSFSVLGGAASAADEPDTPKAEGDVTVIGTCIAINEIMAKNDSTLADSEGEFGDWIELVNLSDQPIDVSGYEISDEKDTWTFPEAVEIGAGEFLLVWADEGDSGDADQELHTNFKLGGDGEPITLTNSDGDVVASLSIYPELDDDEAFGVDSSGNYVVLGAGDATPGEGPALDGCDFEIGSASAAATSDGDTANGDDGDDAANDDSDQQASTDDAGAAASGNSPNSLATTGTSARTQSFLAQMLLLSGLVLVTMARISQRRSVR